MQLDLAPEQTTFVDLGIREGSFANREEAMRKALAQWERRERERAQLSRLGEMKERRD
jgi:Arc/MetJ-type ribon-helix-helix transcriptional regulator